MDKESVVYIFTIEYHSAIKNKIMRLSAVTQAYNPSYFKAGVRKDHSLGPAWAKDPITTNTS
jgi:hypothetical protein